MELVCETRAKGRRRKKVRWQIGKLIAKTGEKNTRKGKESRAMQDTDKRLRRIRKKQEEQGGLPTPTKGRSRHRKQGKLGVL